MSKVTFLGLGAMGSRMAHNLIVAGHDVTVWNRTIERTRELASLGATVAPTPRAASDGAEVVISMVRDDHASSEVWLDAEYGALSAMQAGSVGIECSTLSTVFMEVLRGRFEELGRDLVDAPLAGSRPQAEAKQLIFFAGGDRAVVEKVSPLLKAMGSSVHYCGRSGSGAALKLMVNSLLGIQVAAMAELLGFATKAGIDEKLAVDVIATTPVASPALKAAASAMVQRDFSPAFPIDLVSKDFDLIEKSANSVSTEVPMATAAGTLYRTACLSGIADDNLPGIVQLYQAAARDR